MSFGLEVLILYKEESLPESGGVFTSYRQCLFFCLLLYYVMFCFFYFSEILVSSVSLTDTAKLCKKSITSGWHSLQYSR